RDNSVSKEREETNAWMTIKLPSRACQGQTEWLTWLDNYCLNTAFAQYTVKDFPDSVNRQISQGWPEDQLPKNLLQAGFDTPAESWIKGIHAGFVRDLLVSPRVRNRGFWSVCAIEKLLEKSSHPCWFDIVWKLICIETWARIYLDGELPYGVTNRESELPTRFIDNTSDQFWQQELAK
ncbi:MAG: hypothetical protein AB1489_25305, partial [Acidobacteriota bacterium]